MYKPGGTIADALRRIQTKTYVLPAIQREFVWKPEQIERLFDSLMQGYPIGTFLFWKVEAETSNQFKFYDFVRNYHQRDAAHCPELGTLHQQSVTAVLDGQQRLTALNIGLRGSMAIKRPNAWWTNPDAFPVRTLRLNLSAPPVADEDGLVYKFSFLTDEQATRDTSVHWFQVKDVLGMEGGPAMVSSLMKRGLADDALMDAYTILDRLHTIVHKQNSVSYYEEEAQDLERVLNIFIRMNSGGTALSYSDLLLSVAVAQWEKVDARSEIHRLVDELNKIGAGFAVSQDFVLKAGLMLSDINSVGFKVENFTAQNMKLLEANWPHIRTALIRTVELVASFGFSGQSLRADSALLPIAYYLYNRAGPDNYVTHSKYLADREQIRIWLTRSILKASGIWGSGLDTLLTALREVFRTNQEDRFPVEELSQVMSARGKTLNFEPAEIEDLLHLPYGDRRVFALLALLFPFVDLKNNFHVDHVFPISRFGKRRLEKFGLTDEEVDTISRQANELPNLQLLDGSANIEKQAEPPSSWLDKNFPGTDKRQSYCDRHLLGDVPNDISGFGVFYEARREKLRERLIALLTATT